jgi:hypothetical protein
MCQRCGFPGGHGSDPCHLAPPVLSPHEAWVEAARVSLKQALNPRSHRSGTPQEDIAKNVTWWKAEIERRSTAPGAWEGELVRRADEEKERVERAARAEEQARQARVEREEKGLEREAVRLRPTRLPPWVATKGTTLPRCPSCNRALRQGRTHVCKALRRSHRRPETDALPSSPKSTAPVELGPLLPFLAEGVTFDCKCVNEMNASGWGWQRRRALRRDQHRRVAAALAPYRLPPGPCWVCTITIIHWGHYDAHDGLRSAGKSIVDAVALALDVDDGDTERFTPRYAQETTRLTEIVQTRRGNKSQSVNRVRIEIRSAEGRVRDPNPGSAEKEQK